MKTKLLFLAAVMSIAVMKADAQKIGYLNTNDLLALMPEVKAADSILNVFAKDAQAIYNNYVTEYQMSLKDYSENKDTWSALKIEAAEQDLGDLEQKITNFESQSNYLLEQKKQELYGPILENVKTKIKEVGAEGKFTTILDGSAMLYTGTDAIDVMPLMKKKLGIE